MEDIKIEDSSWSHYSKDKNNIIFVPSVSKQRYSTVQKLLFHAKWEKEICSVTEYGCASYKFFPFLKNTLNINKINFVDVDDYLLEEKLDFIRPLLYDHFNKRTNPLEVNVFEGSISDPDSKILHSDAVVGIEIIEHLFPDALEAVPYVIFHTVKPKIVIFTTPNADFNEALPNFEKFRHPDHKFEWTREQFKSWASNIILRFPYYEVKFFGVGRGPRGTSSLGFCSQLALFVRQDMLDSSYNVPILRCFCGETEFQTNSDRCRVCHPMQPFGICTYLTKSKKFICAEGNDQSFYRLVETSIYPHKEEDKRSREERLLDSLKYKIYDKYLEYTNENGVAEIPLYKITTIFEGQLITEKEMKDVLILHGYEVKDCLLKNCNGDDDEDWAPCVLYQRSPTPSSVNSEILSSEDENSRISNEKSESDWDEDIAITRKDRWGHPNGSVFPGWLLRILRNNFPAENEDASNEWAYLYSQGDGWGNNTPWIVRNNDDENEDASSEASSTNDSISIAEDRSSIQEIASLPDDNRAFSLSRNRRQINNLRLHDDDSEEYFDTLDIVPR